MPASNFFPICRLWGWLQALDIGRLSWQRCLRHRWALGLKAIETRGQQLPFCDSEIVVQFLSSNEPLLEPSDEEVKLKMMAPLQSLPFDWHYNAYSEEQLHLVHVTQRLTKPLASPYGTHYPHKLFGASFLAGPFAVQLLTFQFVETLIEEDQQNLHEIYNDENIMVYSESCFVKEDGVVVRKKYCI